MRRNGLSSQTTQKKRVYRFIFFAQILQGLIGRYFFSVGGLVTNECSVKPYVSDTVSATEPNNAFINRDNCTVKTMLKLQLELEIDI